MPLTISSPIQARSTFGEPGSFPRQKHVYLARFSSPGRSSNNVKNLTFAMKSIDRPKFQPKTEMLNQYNKKRQVYTGYTIEPIRAQLIDSRDGAAQNMWTEYSQYYFGDFASSAKFNYDVTTPNINPGSFGFTASNGGAKADSLDAQYYFNAIEIYHFYDGVVDQYDMINPRITAFEPDDLDYANSEVSVINMTFACEAVHYKPQQRVSPSHFPEFQGRFWGRPLEVEDAESSPFPATFGDALSAFEQSGGFGPGGFFTGGGNPLDTISDIFRTVRRVKGIVNDFRSGDIRHALGSLSRFGNYSFGASYSGPSLGAMAYASPSFADTMALQNSAALYGINSQEYANAAAAIQGQTSAYGSAPTTFANGLAAAQQIDGSGMTSDSSGAVLSPSAYNAVNAQQTGTAQYGYNPSDSLSDRLAMSWDGTKAGLDAINAADAAQRTADVAAINAQVAGNAEFGKNSADF